MRAMVRLLHLADVHLGASFATFGELAERRSADVLAAFRRLPEVAAALDVHAVLVAGDLYDSPTPGAEARAAAREVAERLVHDGRPVFVVPGNHDSCLYRPSPWIEGTGPWHVFRAPVFGEPVSVDTPGGPLHVYGLAFDGARAPDPLAGWRRAPGAGFHVALLHGSLAASERWTASPTTLRITSEALERLDADYVALGDHHRFRPPAQMPGGRACYAGSFAALDLNEWGPRGFALVELDPDGVRVAHHRSGVAEVVEPRTLDVTGYDDEAAVLAACAASVPEGAIPVLTLSGSVGFPLDAEAVAAAIGRRFGHARVVDRTMHFSSRRLDLLAHEDTIAGHLVRAGRRRIAEAADQQERRLGDRALRIALRELGVEG
jgi:DNA repair exonuclease SbcCD nuclease subunit